MIYDFCVVGGGIVGVAAANALLEHRPDASLLLLEKEPALGRHQTGRNSGVIHSGVYYAPGSLKARLCREGLARTKAFCQEHGIPYEDRGKLIVATRPEELPRLEALQTRAAENGMEVERLEAPAIAECEPNITGRAALLVPAAAIVDYSQILAALARQVQSRGGEIRLQSEVEGIAEQGGQVTVHTGDETIAARRLVACAGLQSDRLARLAGMRISHRIVPFRGEYFRLAPHLSNVVHSMIYPVPEPGLPFLGTHLTPMVGGSVSVGPNAVLGLAREGYAKGSISLRDMQDVFGFPGFWISIARNIRPGLNELGNTLFKRRYLAECQKYCPMLTLPDLQPMDAGIRAQAILSDGTMAHDFLFAESPRMLHVCNAPSPAATSALPIGQMIAERLLAHPD